MSKVIDNIRYSNDLKTVEEAENKEITTAVIKEGVTTIGGSAFRECTNLQNVAIPESVTEIGKDAFKRCKIENYEHKLFKIKNGCFLSSDEKTVLYCTNDSKQEIVIPEGVTTIEVGAFRECKNLQNVAIPESVTEIGVLAFSWCEKLQSVVIPEGVTTIEGSAFRECTNLQNVAIPSSVTTIRYDAFWCCENLQSVVIPESVTTIGDEAFKGCKNLKEVHLGGNIEKLSGQIFDGCPDVELYAPEKSLTEKAIKKNAKLKKLYKKDEYSLNQAKNAKITEIKAAGTEGLLRAYSEGIGKEQKIGQVEKNIEVMIFTNELSSENNSKYAKITVPEKTAQKKLSEIQNAFDEVRSEGENVTVEKLLETLKKNVESFEWEIYNEKDDITIYLVKVLKGKKTPFFYTFYSVYKKFTNVIISKKVKEIKDHAFYKSSLESITIPEGVTSIGGHTFNSCENLQNVVIPSSVTSIGAQAFECCENLQSVVIPSSVTWIGSWAFCGCTNLTITFDGTKEEWDKIGGGGKPGNVKFNK